MALVVFIWTVLSRALFFFGNQYSSRYLSSLLTFGIPIATIPLYLLCNNTNRFKKNLQYTLYTAIIVSLVLLSFFKLNRYNGARPADYELFLKTIRQREKSSKAQRILDFSKEDYRLQYYSSGNIQVISRLNEHYSPSMYPDYNKKLDALLNSTDKFFALASKKDESLFNNLQRQFNNKDVIVWRICAKTKRHVLYEGTAFSDRYGSRISPDDVNAPVDGNLVWDSTITDTGKLDDTKCIATLKKQGFLVDDNIIFPRKLFIHIGHGFYNHNPETIAEIKCIKSNKITEIIFHNEGQPVYGGVYSKDKFKISKGIHCTVIFRGLNGGHFTISGRFIRKDNSFRFIKLHSFTVLQENSWYRGTFTINEEIKDDELFCPVIEFEGGTVSIANLYFWTNK